MTKIALLAAVLALTSLGPVAAFAEDVAAEATTTEANPEGRLKVETIRVEGSGGTIEEERVQAMRSEIRYIPTGSADGYNLTGSTGTTLNAHSDDDMLIPSWNMFSW
ncbi:MAG: DUF2782 domain-containing protein [Gammaproteobacteria bacterium]|nr:DUF2782 domain-containing protein [Gammaproteobacteria bacterium]MBU1724599.1 DUF2782 domain-containing protein [Gammaproteobacteria bacterium]MBU2005311.1 DUF2782 domain-containing protein [Gammaproteobacteria bacterium]